MADVILTIHFKAEDPVRVMQYFIDGKYAKNEFVEMIDATAGKDIHLTDVDVDYGYATANMSKKDA